MDATTFKNMQGAAGYKAPLCVDDLFNTVRYNGAQSTAKSVTGVGFKPDMVIIKNLSGGSSSGVPVLYDSVSGVYRYFQMNSNSAQQYETNRGIKSFDDDGFSLDSMNWAYANEGGNKYIASCWKKAPYFFDIVEYNGTGSNQNISHKLGCAPSMMWIFQVDYSSGLSNGMSSIYHSGFSDYPNDRSSFYDTGSIFNSSNFWNSTAPTSSVFSVGSSDYTNQSGKSYIAYLFAAGQAKFGPQGGECIAGAGVYTNPGGGGAKLGISPSNWSTLYDNARYVLNKKRSGSGDWEATDSAFGLVTQGAYASSGGGMPKMVDYSTAAGVQVEHQVQARALGGNPYGFSTYGGGSSQSYVYYCIVESQKIPKSGAEVFGAAKGKATLPAVTTGLEQERFDTGVQADMVWRTNPDASTPTEDTYMEWTLRQFNESYLNFSKNWEIRGHHNGYTTEGERFDLGFSKGFYEDGANVGNNENFVGWSFKKARHFFATSMWEGNNGSTRYVRHNLRKTPEFMWIKCTNSNRRGHLYFDFDSGNNTYARTFLDEGTATSTYTANDTYLKGLPNAGSIVIGDDSAVNTMTSDYVACLFSSCPGVCKIGKYTGTGSNLSIDCGFESPARFIMIKRVDANESWMIWDYVRGIVSPQTPTGSTTYGTSGSHTFTVPSGVNSVSFAAIGAGGAGKSPNPGYSGMGGGGGGGAYKNSVSVTPGDTFGVCVGSGGASTGPSGPGSGSPANCGTNSYVTQSGTKIVEAQGGRGGGYAGTQAVMLCGDGGGGGGYNMGGNGMRHDSAGSQGYGHYSGGSGGYGAGGGGGNGFLNNGKWQTAMNGLGVYDQNPPNPSLAGGQGFNGGQPGGNASNKCAGYYGAGGGGGRYGNPGASGAKGAVQAMWGAVYPNLSGDDPVLFWDRIDSYHPQYESAFVNPTSTGFELVGSASYSGVNGGLSGSANASGGDFWYMAIS